MIAHDRRLAGSLLAVIGFLIVFGSLYPFSFSLHGAEELARLGALPRAGTTRSDVAANVLLYLPLGACLAWLLAARLGAALAVPVATLIGAALSFAIETAQLYETRRVASLADFACNTAAYVRRRLARARNRAHAPQPACVAASRASCATRSRLRCSSPGSGTASRPLHWCSIPRSGQAVSRRSSPATAWSRRQRSSRTRSPGSCCCRSATGSRPGRAATLAGGTMAVVLAGRDPVRGHGDSSARSSPAWRSRSLLARPLARLPHASARASARGGAVPVDRMDRALALRFPGRAGPLRVPAVRRVADAVPRREPRRHVPALLHERRAGLAAGPGRPPRCSRRPASAPRLYSPIELLQTWLPGQTAEITDPLLAVCAGGLIARVRAGGRRRVSRHRPGREHDRQGMVYLSSMTSVLAALLLVASSAEGQAVAETAAGDQPAGARHGAGRCGCNANRSGSAAGRAACLSFRKRPRRPVPAKQAAPNLQLRILGAGHAAWRPTSSSGRCTRARASRRPCPTPSGGRAVRARRRPRLRAADRLQQPWRHAVPARRLRRRRPTATRKSLDLLESTQGISSRRLVVPLAGLGAVYAAQDQHQVAAEHFERALAVSRRADGLFNLQQMPLIRQAADSRFAISDFAGRRARAHVRAQDRRAELRLRRPAHHPAAARVRRVLRGPARVHRGARSCTCAHATSALAAKPGYSPDAVAALTGIARCHRLQYSLDPDPSRARSRRATSSPATSSARSTRNRACRRPPPTAPGSSRRSRRSSWCGRRRTRRPSW